MNVILSNNLFKMSIESTSLLQQKQDICFQIDSVHQKKLDKLLSDKQELFLKIQSMKNAIKVMEEQKHGIDKLSFKDDALFDLQSNYEQINKQIKSCNEKKNYDYNDNDELKLIDKQINKQQFIDLIKIGSIQEIKESYNKQFGYDNIEKLKLVFDNSYDCSVLQYFIDECPRHEMYETFTNLIIKFSKNSKDYDALKTIIYCKYINRTFIDTVFYTAVFEAILGNNDKAVRLLKFTASAKLTYYSNNKIQEFKDYMEIK